MRRRRITIEGFDFEGTGVLSRNGAGIGYKRLTDVMGSIASDEVEFPNGGAVVLVGHLVQQGSTSEHGSVISFGAEGYVGTRRAIVLAHHTLVDDWPSESPLLRVARGEGK